MYKKFFCFACFFWTLYFFSYGQGYPHPQKDDRRCTWIKCPYDHFDMGIIRPANQTIPRIKTEKYAAEFYHLAAIRQDYPSGVQGRFSEIKFHWDDKKRILKIADRSGSFPGMLNQRRFRIVVATKGDHVNEDSNNYKW